MSRIAIVTVFILFAVSAAAQSPPPAWKPSKPVEFVVSAAPGGANDRLARAIQRIVQERELSPMPLSVRRALVDIGMAK